MIQSLHVSYNGKAKGVLYDPYSDDMHLMATKSSCPKILDVCCRHPNSSVSLDPSDPENQVTRIPRKQCDLDEEKQAFNDDSCFSEVTPTIQCGKRNKDGLNQKSLKVRQGCQY